MEIWDLYDRGEHLVGKDWKRSEQESIPNNLYHLVSEILVRHADGDFLIMQRDFSKTRGPGTWEATSGGSALKGESVLECAKRELLEETGIECGNFTEIGFSIQDDKHGIYHSYLATVDCDKKSITLQIGETIDYKWISANEFIEYMKTDQLGEDQKERYSSYVESLKSEIGFSSCRND